MRLIEHLTEKLYVEDHPTYRLRFTTEEPGGLALDHYSVLSPPLILPPLGGGGQIHPLFIRLVTNSSHPPAPPRLLSPHPISPRHRCPRPPSLIKYFLQQHSSTHAEPSRYQTREPNRDPTTSQRFTSILKKTTLTLTDLPYTKYTPSYSISRLVIHFPPITWVYQWYPRTQGIPVVSKLKQTRTTALNRTK